MVTDVRDGICSALKRTENYICGITEDDLPFLNLDDLQSHLDIVKTLQAEYEHQQTLVIASLNSGAARESEIAARCDFRCQCFALIDRIEEVMEHVAEQLGPAQNPAIPEGMNEIFDVMQRFLQNRQEHLRQLITAVQTASSNHNFDAYAACPVEPPQLMLPPITSSGLLALQRHHKPHSESPTASNAFHVSLHNLNNSQSMMDNSDSEFGRQGGKTCDACDRNYSNLKSKVSHSCRANASTSTASYSDLTANPRRQSSETVPSNHFAVVHESTTCSTRSSHSLDSHHPTMLQERLSGRPDDRCGTTRDLNLCYEASFSPEPNSCTSNGCSGSVGRHKYQLEKTYSDDYANWKAPSSSHWPTFPVAQSRHVSQPLHYQEWPPDDNFANLPAPIYSSPTPSTKFAHTGFWIRHKASTAYPTERSRDDDTADLMASSSSSLSSSSATAQSLLAPGNSPVTPSHGSATLSTSVMANSNPLFPATGHLATATMECHSAEHEVVTCCAIIIAPRQELNLPEHLPDISMGNTDKGIINSTELPTHLDVPGESSPPKFNTLSTGTSSLHGTILGHAIVDEYITPPAPLLIHHDTSIPLLDDSLLKAQTMIEDSPTDPLISTFHPERPFQPGKGFQLKSPFKDIPNLMGNPLQLFPLSAYADAIAMVSFPTMDLGSIWRLLTANFHHCFSVTGVTHERSLAPAIANVNNRADRPELVLWSPIICLSSPADRVPSSFS